jgi:Caspase domain
MQVIHLITALNEYDRFVYGTNSALKMPITDAQNYRAVMVKENDVLHSLYDRYCDAERIKSAWTEIVDECKQAPTRVVWYHSGHGTFADSKGKRRTGRCLYDRVLWDHEVARMIRQLPGGTELVTISDTCHAESNSRMVPDSSARPRYMAAPKDEVLAATKGRIPSGVAYLAISSCGIKQVSYENHQGGVFTNALVQSLKLGSLQTWNGVFIQASALIPKQYRALQWPVAETNDAGRVLFNSDIINE